MKNNLAGEKLAAYKLLTTYGCIKHLVLLNFPFDEDWLMAYTDDNRDLVYSEEYLIALYSNKNLQVDWLELNKQYGIKPAAYDYSYGEKKPSCIFFDETFDLSKLTQILLDFPYCDTFDYVKQSIDVWHLCLEDIIDIEMIQAWYYSDNLRTQIIRYDSEIFNQRNCEWLENDAREISDGKWDDSSENNIIDDVFEGDSDYLWNID
jgi:hypothetical protein